MTLGQLIRGDRQNEGRLPIGTTNMITTNQRRLMVLATTALPLLTLSGIGFHRYYLARIETPRKLADGVYSLVATEASARAARVKVNSFALWKVSGHLKAVIESEPFYFPVHDPNKPHHQTETLEMNSDLSMRRLRYELENTEMPGDGALDCTVALLSLDCVSTFERASGKGSIKVKGGYAAQFGAEAALLDFPWFFTTLVAQAGKRAQGSRPLQAVTIAFDGQAPDRLVTGRVLGAKVDYLGAETVQIMDHAIQAHKLHLSGGRSRDLPDLESTVWVSDGGLLLALDWIGERWELTDFMQHDRLIPELGVEDDGSTAIRNSGQLQRRESVHLQRAVWVEVGGQEESLYMALHGMGLVEAEEDKIGISDGKRFLHVQITDAGKAAAVDWQEGAFAWGFPIAQEKIIDIRPDYQSEKHRSALYVVAYRWELNELGRQLKDYLPQRWLSASSPLTAQVGLRYENNKWKVETVLRPSETALRSR